jgi:hypothetical protein
VQRHHGCAARGIHYCNLAQSYVLTAGTAETLVLTSDTYALEIEEVGETIGGDCSIVAAIDSLVYGHRFSITV